MLDIFRQNAFSVIALTDAVNKVPFTPGRAGSLINWNPQGIATTTVAIEERGGTLALLNPTPRGAPGETVAKEVRNIRDLRVPHYEELSSVMAEEVQGVRAFGSENSVQSVRQLVDQRIADAVLLRHDPTLEYQRIGAVKGIILNGNGSTLVNLFTEFGVTAIADVDFNLDAATPARGILRKTCAGVVRAIANELGGVPFVGMHAFCGDAFFDDLIAHTEVIESYKGTPMAQVLREGYVYPNGLQIFGAFEFGGIVFENYRGAVGGTAFVNTNEAHFFPVGVPGLFRTVFAPADYIETVNTIGLPRYAKQYPMPNGKGVHIETQMNPISYCTRPRVLVKGLRT
jgi:hypothetical protein